MYERLYSHFIENDIENDVQCMDDGRRHQGYLWEVYAIPARLSNWNDLTPGNIGHKGSKSHCDVAPRIDGQPFL